MRNDPAHRHYHKMKKLNLLVIVILASAINAVAQVPMPTLIRIVKAEDRRDIEPLAEILADKNPRVRERATLAAGRIGREDAVPVLREMMEKDPDDAVRVMAAFALGEIESAKCADSIIRVLSDQKSSAPLRARAVEAAGKIVAANTREERILQLTKSILEVLETESRKGPERDREVVIQAITAGLRARPPAVEFALARYLTDEDARIRADAANGLGRIRANNANDLLRKVRVSALRSLAALRHADAAVKLIKRGNELLIPIHGDPAPLKPGEKRGPLKPIEIRIPKTELLEIATALGRLLPGTANEEAVIFLNKLRMADGFSSPETEIALAQIAPKEYVAMRFPDGFAYKSWHLAAAYAQGMGEIGKSKDKDLVAEAGIKLTEFIAGMATVVKPKDQANLLKAIPDLTRGLAALNPENLDEILRGQLKNEDVFIRAAAAELIAGRPKTKENTDALNSAYIKAVLIDKHDNDAKLSILDALGKLDKKAGSGNILMALNDYDYLVRKKAFELLEDKQLLKDLPGIPNFLESAREKKSDQVLTYTPIAGSKLGQVLSSDADYRRALSRKNGSIKAVLTTDKGTFTIEFAPEQAPLTVDNYVRLARSGYFNGLEVHRVVANFVMQDGDPRGDGNGGPGLSIRCEINMQGYDRGAVGMALSGKDTGGSQWFITHSPQSYLDGGYTVFGHVNETDMKVVDSIARGDRILSVKIVGK